MKNIGLIFRKDIGGLLKNFLALVIALGVCALPALYAWFNIYANWDPYANTGNVRIAVVNNDKGWINEDKENINIGQSVVNELKEKDSIGWVFLETEQEATEGVKSGNYYAAIVIDADFTYGMYRGVKENVENPRIVYYVNDKKNAVATKITDSAISAVQRSVNKQFIQIVVEGIFEKTNLIYKDLENEDIVGTFVSKLEAVDESLKEYSGIIESLMDGNDKLSGTAGSVAEEMESGRIMIQNGINSIEEGRSKLSSTQTSFNTFSSTVTTQLTTIETTLNTLSQQIQDAQFNKDVEVLKEDLAQIGVVAGQLADELTQLNIPFDEVTQEVADTSVKEGVLPDGTDTGETNLEKYGINNILSLQSTINSMRELANEIGVEAGAVDITGTADYAVEQIQSSLLSYSQSVAEIRKMYDVKVVPRVTNLISQMGDVLSSVEIILNNISDTTGTMGDIFVGVSDTLDIFNMSLSELQGIMDNARFKVEDALETIKEADSDNKFDVVMDILGGEPKVLGEFFSEPVQVNDNYIYEISNYGSGVAPFYTTLAIWVGMTILVSIVKVHANGDGLDNVKPSELYFGRYFTFLLFSQIQTAIIVWGDLVLLKIQCLHPWKFYLVSAMASLVFSLLIYSLTISFGDIGKAMAVVVMVIQIAGSGGTYPIEALPSFFRAVYIFFPFPYVINAMRECIGGMYEHKYLVCMLQLALFVVAALVIGLVIRIPFIRLNEFIEKRMEDTKML